MNTAQTINEGPARIHRFSLEDGGATGVVVIDSTLGGGGTGGIRMGKGVTEREIVDLAHEMTLKFAWLNIPRGGAKAGICIDNEVEETAIPDLLGRFGDAIAPLLNSGEYVAGMDLGIGDREMAMILRGTGANRVLREGQSSTIDSNFYTALTVFSSMQALLRQRGRSLAGTSCLVEGLGKVGTHLVTLLDNAGASIVGVSTLNGALLERDGIDVRKLVEIRNIHGDACVQHYGSGYLADPRALYFAEADMLAPGARTNSINSEDVPHLKVRYIVSIANSVTSPDTELVLHAAGIDYLPGFVSNSGGIFCWYMSHLTSEGRESLILKGFARKVERLVRTATIKRIPISMCAREQANANERRMLEEKEGSLLRRLQGQARKFSPRRIGYVLGRKILGEAWAARPTFLCRRYFESRYFS